MKQIFSAVLAVLFFSTAVSTAQVIKPDYVRSKGFFTLNGKIYNPDGSEFIMRGVSQNHYWGTESFNLNSIDGIAKTHANTVRVVMSNADWQNQSRTPDKKRALVQKYIAKGLVPMVEQHDGTCDGSASTLEFITDIWTMPENVEWLNEYEKYVILNIANEWGPGERNDAGWRYWRDAYKNSITQIREAGINTMLVIDSPDCGQGPRAMETYGRELLDFDPQHNVVFSIHMYGMWRTMEKSSEVGQPNKNDQPWLAESELQTMLDLGLPVIVGEFSWSEAESVGYDTQRLITFCGENGIGWLAWAWNGNSDVALDMAKGWKYSSDADLFPFGDLIINHPLYGLRATSNQATVFGTSNHRPVVELVVTAGQPIEAGADITLTANAADADGQVARVVFYHGEQKLGETSTMPYSVLWPKAPRGRHQLYAVAWDNAGQIGASNKVELRIGYREKTQHALLVVGETQLKPGDAAVYERLEMLGFVVQVVDDDEVKIEQAQDQNIILISSTCVPTRVKSTFRDVQTPVVIWENQLFDDMNMTGAKLNTDYGREDADAVIIPANSHPAAGGLTGKIVVYTKSDRVTWALPSENADIIAVSPTNAQRPVLFIYKKGDQMAGLAAPAARAGIFLQDNSAELLTVEGWRLLDAVVDYVSDAVSQVGSSDVEPIVDYELAQNHPNPFNPSTRIEFRLNQEAEVQLDVFNMQGQRVARLAEGSFAAGRHQVMWQGTDQLGKDAANGVYCYRLKVTSGGERHAQTRKMTLMR